MDCGSSGSGMPSPKLLPPQGRKAPRNRHPTSLPSRGPAASPAAEAVENYFNYFTEIEEHFQRRRGTILLLSTLDWALIETWKDAGIALEAVLRGIDNTFDKYQQRPSRSRKVNSLAYCSQEVLAAAEDMKEASVGTTPAKVASGIDTVELEAFLRRCASELDRAATRVQADGAPHGSRAAVYPLVLQSAQTLRELAEGITSQTAPPKLEDL